MILVTGSSGLIGRHLGVRLARENYEVRSFDLKRSLQEDVRDKDSIERALGGVRGIVHLAAISRVVYGESAPDECWATNVEGLRSVINCALNSRLKPWLIFVSSREIYGNASQSPTNEDAPEAPLNTYARSKVAGEHLVKAARSQGLTANICRLSTVYGATDDYPDRVLPAFCRAAAEGGRIRIDGAKTVLDPTHVEDVVEGLCRLTAETAAGRLLPAVHFVSGRGYSLQEIADIAIQAGGKSTSVTVQAPRAYDVNRFVGDPSRAKSLLGWSPVIDLENGVRRLVEAFRLQETARAELGEQARSAGQTALKA